MRGYESFSRALYGWSWPSHIFVNPRGKSGRSESQLVNGFAEPLKTHSAERALLTLRMKQETEKRKLFDAIAVNFMLYHLKKSQKMIAIDPNLRPFALIISGN